MLPVSDPGDIAVQNAVDEATAGALYALHYESSKNGWDPHVWAQKLEGGRVRFIFYATDKDGSTRYFDHESNKDTGNLGATVLFFERLLESKRALLHILRGLDRIAAGLTPTPRRVEVGRFN